MVFHPDDPSTWPIKYPIIAHDVGRKDSSTAVVGGHDGVSPGSAWRPNNPRNAKEIVMAVSSSVY
jgi:hypothetical protein